ncbi:MAG: Fe-Mn family superoxide dismutase [Patescibacteria group bacterium]
MEKFTEKAFNIGELKGISSKNIEEHLKLYKGYVTNTNLILEKIEGYNKDLEANTYVIAELQRRFSFEFNGMRNHEYYFAQFEGGYVPSSDSPLKEKITQTWGTLDAWFAQFKSLAMTRGVGWAILFYDPLSDKLLHAWVEEQQLGHLIGLTPVLCLDMWEHAYVYDYPTSEKKKYVEAFFENLNWGVVEENFRKVQ